MDYKQSTSIVVLGALAAIVLTTVGNTVDIGSPHVALAAAAATSHFRHFVTTTPSHFRHFTNSTANATATATTTTTTTIKHIIVIFQENNSFDHYFGTYPNAANPTGEPAFNAAAGTPHVMNLIWPNNLLSPNNPNQKLSVICTSNMCTVLSSTL
ncbi:MAG: alkaline phosphatase family protein [Candidatus Nitrosopolaris sp.]